MTTDINIVLRFDITLDDERIGEIKRFLEGNLRDTIWDYFVELPDVITENVEIAAVSGDMQFLIDRYLEHQNAMKQSATHKQSLLEYEECRSYSSQIVNQLLIDNPLLKGETNDPKENH